MLVIVPEVYIYKSEQNILMVAVWLAEELFDYLHPFLFSDIFQQKLNKYQFQVLFEIIKTYSSINLRKNKLSFTNQLSEKKREIRKLRIIDDSSLYSEKELDSINYFKGKGYYGRCPDPSVAPNIFDNRQSFLLKMHIILALVKNS